MKNNRTKNFQMRITSDEYEWLKEKSASYTSVTHFVRSTLAEYSNINAKQKLELINELGSYYRKVQNELSWAGGNLNQSVKRANELAVARLLTPSYIQLQNWPLSSDSLRLISSKKVILWVYEPSFFEYRLPRYSGLCNQNHNNSMIIASKQPNPRGSEYPSAKFILCLKHQINPTECLWIMLPQTICHQGKQLRGFTKVTLLSRLHWWRCFENFTFHERENKWL